MKPVTANVMDAIPYEDGADARRLLGKYIWKIVLGYLSLPSRCELRNLDLDTTTSECTGVIWLQYVVCECLL